MKHIKKLLVFLLIINVFNSCEKEEIVSYALDDISAPTEVNAHFDISQTEVGLVTLTPTAEGATLFKVYFGDVANETPVEVAPGQTISHTYVEGEYNLRIIAVGLTGLTSEFVRVVIISMEPPTDLKFDLAISNTNPFAITVTPTAVNATVFDVYFGDVENEEATTIMAGETANKVYAQAGTFDVKVVARGAGAATSQLTKSVTITGASNAVSLPITFDDATVNYAFGTFNGASFEVVDNPFVSGANNVASKVGAIKNGGNAYEGGAFTLGTPVDFGSDNKTIKIKFYSTVSVPILLKFEGGVSGERQNEVVVTHGGTGWEELSFNFATNAVKSYIDGNQGVGEPFVPTGKYATLVLFVDGPGTTAGTFYMDDIKQTAGGGASTPVAATNMPIDFESNQTLTGVFEGAVTGKPIPNPDKSGINTSATVYEFHKVNGAVWYSGIFQIFPQNIDFSTQKSISFKIWSPKAGVNIRLQLEKEGGGGGPTIFADKTITEANKWVTLTYNFADIDATKAYDKIVIFPNFNEATQPAGDGSKYYIDDIQQTTGGTATGGKTKFPINFETPATGGTSEWKVFEGETPPLQVVDNPDATGINTSSKVAKFTAPFPGANYAGTNTVLETPFTLNATNSTVKIMVYKSVISDVGIKFEANSASTGEIKVANTKINQWEEITFDFSGKIGEASSVNINGIVIFPDFNNRSQTNIVYFDNITLSASTGGGGAGGGNATAPSAAAPIPTLAASNVISMFSGAYTNVAVDTWRTDWSQGDLEEVSIAGNATKKYTKLNFVGVETVSSQINASNMTHFHVDFWTGNLTEIRIKLVDFGPDGAYSNGGDDREHEVVFANPAKNQWVSLDIPLSSFTGLTTRSNIAQLIFSGSPANEGTVFIDNVYFHN